MRLLVLTDYRGAFWSSTTRTQSLTTMDVPLLATELRLRGIEPEFRGFSELDLSEDLQGVPFIYTSYEDRGLEYRQYVEDQVLALVLAGADPIPSFPLLRAHHNKVFMEQLRRLRLPQDPMIRRTEVFGTVEEFIHGSRLTPPVFVKAAAGSSSKGVHFCPDTRSLQRTVRRVSASSAFDQLDEMRLSLKYPGYVRRSTHRRRFVVQEQIEGISGDFKLLRYGTRFFGLFRRNREDDPRASGSGQWDRDWAEYCDPLMVLDYARSISDQLNESMVSLDIAVKDGACYLLEFQAVYFGPAALETAEYHYVRHSDGWIRVAGTVPLETALADSVADRLGVTP